MTSYKILIIKDTPKTTCDQFIWCSPFYTISCIDSNIVARSSEAHKLLITSKNGALALIANIESFNNKIKHQAIITVGSQTYQALKDNGFDTLISQNYDIKSLVAQVDLTGVLYLSGFHTSFREYELYNVQRMIIYKSIERKIPLQIINQVLDGAISHILLYSQRGASIFLKSFPQTYTFSKIQFIYPSKAMLSLI